MLDSGLVFFLNNNETILAFLVVVLILLFTLLFVVFFMQKKNPEAASGISDELEQNLRAILESADFKGGGSADNGEEILSLQQELDAKVVEIDLLKSAIDSQSKLGDIGSEELDEMKAKLVDLEAKLAEYEIIEDDIANLSIYKEENVKLKEELAKLKDGDISEPEPEVESKSEVEPEPEPEEVSSEDFNKNIDKNLEAINATEEEDNDDILADFVSAVSSEGEIKEKLNIKEKETEPPKIATAKEEVEVEVESKQEGSPDDDIMAEFSAIAGSSDEEVAVTKKAEPKPVVASVLEEETDPDKILNEMDDLMSAPAQVDTGSEEDGDPSEKLISEFESITAKEKNV